MKPRGAAFFTIGVYGTTEESFFKALKSAGITHFCDVRRRRGMRGGTYAYANSKALQELLQRARIEYRHDIHLSPPVIVRKIQKEADETAGNLKSTRASLSASFVNEFEKACLSSFDSEKFQKSFPTNANVVLFCVERIPESCHRSIIARRLEIDLGVTVQDITP